MKSKALLTGHRALLRALGLMAPVLILWSLGSAVLPRKALAQSSVAARQSEWEGIGAAARREGKLVIYYGMAPVLLDRLKEDFAKVYPGIAVEAIRLQGMALPTRVEAEAKSGVPSADVGVFSELLWGEEQGKKGSFKVPAGPAASKWPTKYWLAQSVPVLGLEPAMIVYNTSMLKAEITGYQDLLRPELKGRIGLSEPQTTSSVAWLDWLDKTQGPDYMGKLADQKPRLYTGAVPNTQAAAAGEIYVTGYSFGSVAAPLIAQRAPIRMVVPKPSFALSYIGTIFGHAKNPNSAQLFLDYLMSERGQTLWHGQGLTASPLPGVKGSLDPQSITAYDPKAYPDDVVKQLTAKFRKVFEPR